MTNPQIGMLGNIRRKTTYNPNLGEVIMKDMEEEARRAEIEARRTGRKIKQEPVQEEKQEPKPETAEPKNDYVYVPALGLYISEQRNLDGKTWNDTQEILHKEKRRMPTIPEFVEFLKYLRSNDGKANVKSAEKILDEIYTVRSPWRSEWLDAKFDSDKVVYHVFDSKGNIVQREEKLEAYLAKDMIPGIDLEAWLANPTKQGLPKPNCKKGSLYYWSPENGRVARFLADSDGAILNWGRNPDYAVDSLGVRYVEPRRGETAQFSKGGNK